MDARCNGDVCDVLKMQSADEAMKCNVPQTAKEEVDGCKSGLSDIFSVWVGLTVTQG